MFTHPSKIVMSLKNWQWMIPYRHPSLTAVTYSPWWSHLFLFSVWEQTDCSYLSPVTSLAPTKWKDNGWTTTALPWRGINQAFGKFPPDFMKIIKMAMSLRGFSFFPDWLKFADSLKSYVEELGGTNRWTDSHGNCKSLISSENHSKNRRKILWLTDLININIQGFHSISILTGLTIAWEV